MATYNNQLQAQQKPKFSVAITTKGYQSLIANTLRDPARVRRFTASITSAVAVNPALQECDAGTILAGALLGESLNLSPSPQLGQYYLVPFKQKAKYDRNNRLIRPESVTAQFVLGYKGYLQLALRSGQYADLDVTEIKQGEYLGKDSMTGKPKFQFIEDDDLRDALPTVGYMAYFEYVNGFRKVLYWSKEKMMNHADTYSKAFSRQKYEELLAGKIPESEMWKYSSFWYAELLQKLSSAGAQGWRWAVIEMVASYGMSVGREVLDTVLWIGRFYQALNTCCPVRLLCRIEEKRHICHNTRANDAAIRRALIDRFADHDLKNAAFLNRCVVYAPPDSADEPIA